jgi:hypothetical protein
MRKTFQPMMEKMMSGTVKPQDIPRMMDELKKSDERIVETIPLIPAKSTQQSWWPLLRKHA